MLSSTFELQGGTKSITYGIGSSDGPICTDVATLTGHDDLKADNFMFFINESFEDEFDDDNFDGIIGFTPRDESSGPLFLEYLYDAGEIPEKQFAFQLGHKGTIPSSLTIGGYEKDGGSMFDAGRFNFTSHRIGGSFHWQLKMNRIGF